MAVVVVVVVVVELVDVASVAVGASVAELEAVDVVVVVAAVVAVGAVVVVVVSVLVLAAVDVVVDEVVDDTEAHSAENPLANSYTFTSRPLVGTVRVQSGGLSEMIDEMSDWQLVEAHISTYSASVGSDVEYRRL